MSSSWKLRLFANVITCILSFPVICTPFMEPVGAENSTTEDPFVDFANIFRKLVDDVSEIKHGMQLLEKAVLGKVDSANGGHENYANEHIKPKKVRIIVSYPSDDTIDCRVEHEWNYISKVVWFVGGAIVPETKFKQESGSDFFSIAVPSIVIPSLAEFGKQNLMQNLMLHVQVEDIVYWVGFSIPQPNVSANVSGLRSEKEESFIEEIDIHTFTVSGAKNIEYTPGELLKFIIHPHTVRNMTDLSCSIVGVSDKQDENQAVVYFYHRNPDIINITKELTSDICSTKVTINTESMLVGGILSFAEWNAVLDDGMVIKDVYVSSGRDVYLHPSNTESPIPRNRVAEVYDYYENQTLSLLSPESSITCFAIGNPTPKIEFRVEGRHLEWEQADWISPYRTYSTILAPKNMPYSEITCHAESGDAVAEMSINLEYELIVNEKKSKWRKISDELIEATCTITGRPAPDIYFYVDYDSPENILSADDDNVTIVSTTDKDTTTSTLLFNTSHFDYFWSVNCVGRSNGQRREKYFDIPNFK